MNVQVSTSLRKLQIMNNLILLIRSCQCTMLWYSYFVRSAIVLVDLIFILSYIILSFAKCCAPVTAVAIKVLLYFNLSTHKANALNDYRA